VPAVTDYTALLTTVPPLSTPLSTNLSLAYSLVSATSSRGLPTMFQILSILFY